MSLKVTLDEQPRRFDVNIGCNTIGRVTSHQLKPNEPIEENYHAQLAAEGDEKRVDLGWFDTIELAAARVIEYAHGPAKINKIIERPV